MERCHILAHRRILRTTGPPPPRLRRGLAEAPQPSHAARRRKCRGSQPASYPRTPTRVKRAAPRSRPAQRHRSHRRHEILRRRRTGRRCNAREVQDARSLSPASRHRICFSARRRKSSIGSWTLPCADQFCRRSPRARDMDGDCGPQDEDRTLADLAIDGEVDRRRDHRCSSGAHEVQRSFGSA